MSSQKGPLLTVKEMADVLNVAPKTLRQWIHKGLIPNFKINGIVRFDRAQIDAWLAGGARGAN